MRHLRFDSDDGNFVAAGAFQEIVATLVQITCRNAGMDGRYRRYEALAHRSATWAVAEQDRYVGR